MAENGYSNGDSECGSSRSSVQYACLTNGHDKEEDSETGKTTFSPLIRPNRFIGRGSYSEPIHLSAEAGYLVWIDPTSSLQVCFTYGDTQCDFLCYLEPEVAGVSLTFLDEDDNRDSRLSRNRLVPFHSGFAASIKGSTGQRYSCLKTLLNPFSYALDSVQGHCRVELRALTGRRLEDVQENLTKPFRLSFQLVL